MSRRSASSSATFHSRNQSFDRYGVINPGRGWTQTCFTFWPAKSRSVSRICRSVSRSFQTQSGPVLYSRGGFLKSAFTLADSAAAPGAAKASPPHAKRSNPNNAGENFRSAFMAIRCPEPATPARPRSSAQRKPRKPRRFARTPLRLLRYLLLCAGYRHQPWGRVRNGASSDRTAAEKFVAQHRCSSRCRPRR